MADIFLDTLTYYKNEIDQQNTTESLRVDTELSKKIDVLDKGAPGGVATLNGAGDVETTQIPFATQTEADDETNDFRVISPRTLKYVLRDYVNTQDADELHKALSIQVSLGIDVDTIFTNGEYEVDTNLPWGETIGRVKVQEVYNTSRIIQTFKSANTHYKYEREYTNSAWGTWVFDGDPRKFYFDSTSTNQTYTIRMPIGTRVNIDDVWYEGAGATTNIVINVVRTGRIWIIESVPGCLSYFDMSSNEISGTIPDLSVNINLTRFYCYNNKLIGSIPDLNSNTSLINFRCYSNELTGNIPDLSSNIKLIWFYCNDNQLTGSIPDLSSNTSLQYFYCYNNQLTGSIPDLSANTELVSFICSNNQLTSFNGGIIKVSSYFNASNNLLTVDAVDAILQALAASGAANVTIKLEGGNGVPTNTAAIDVLRANGCTVTVEGGY